jgi:hypothetical protein
MLSDGSAAQVVILCEIIMSMRTAVVLLTALVLLQCQALSSGPAQKNRVIVLTDIEADVDDTQSVVRLLLYSNVIDIKGIIATTSTHMRTQIHPESIVKVIRAYGKIRMNLAKHEAGYPDAETLLRLVKRGLPEYGMKGMGEGKDSKGSEWIIRVLDEKDERPLWISVWGGANTLAQALFKIKKTRSEADAQKLIAKLRVYTISDQDDTGIWMRNNFPDLFFIVSPGGYGGSTWSAITEFAPGFNSEVISNKWLASNIQQGHGPMGAVYPDVAYGMEGDTPSWLSLIPNGLNAPEHPNWGGWGGRYELYKPALADMDVNGFTGGVPIDPETRAIWTNATDRWAPYLYNEYGRAIRVDSTARSGNKVTMWRWREDFQNDFAARMDWCTKSYKEANHPPVPVLAHSEEISLQPGEGFWLDGRKSTDPDGDNLSFVWFQYPEAGTYRELIKINGAENLARLYITAPEVKQKETVHFVLKVTDKGTPPLSRYKRVIVNLMPKQNG